MRTCFYCDDFASSTPEQKGGGKFAIPSVFFSFLWHLTVTGTLGAPGMFPKGGLPSFAWHSITRVRSPVFSSPVALAHVASSLKLLRPLPDHLLSRC